MKKHLPWEPIFDQMPLEEEEIGPSGSSCGYPSVTIWVRPNTQPMMDTVRNRGGNEAINGLGDEAYFSNNQDRSAELRVRVGRRVLWMLAVVPAGAKADSVKPGMLRAVRPGAHARTSWLSGTVSVSSCFEVCTR